jgi:hypothetical protein
MDADVGNPLLDAELGIFIANGDSADGTVVSDAEIDANTGLRAGDTPSGRDDLTGRELGNVCIVTRGGYISTLDGGGLGLHGSVIRLVVILTRWIRVLRERNGSR